MTNPDNVGGLPELPPSYGDHCVTDSVRTMREPGYTADQMRAYGEQWRIYGLACGRMSEAATLDWLGNHLVGHINIRTGAGKSYITAENGEQLRYSIDEAMREDLTAYGELCRAAPAGGEPNGKLVGWWNGITPGFDGMGMPSIRWGADAEDSRHDIPLYDGYNPIHYVTPVSAPAGSGEVEEMIERLESTAGAYPEDVFTPLTDEQKRTYGWIVQAASAGMGRHMAPLLRDAAALLRKLQQGAE